MKSTRFFKIALASLFVGGFLGGKAQAALFLDAFDSGASSSNFLVTQIAGSTDTFTFGHDYSVNLIPEAPRSIGAFNAQRGLFLAANNSLALPPIGANNGINVTPSIGGIAINFGQDIRMSFDMWLNISTVTAASTELALFGINTDGLLVNSRTGATQANADGVWYHVSAEGGFGNTSTNPNSRDYVNYIGNAVPGRLDNADSIPTGVFPTSLPVPGIPGNSWVQVDIEEIGGNVRMSMNGITVFDVANTGPTVGSVFLGYQDPFSGSFSGPSGFVVFDNLSVTAVPEPSTFALLVPVAAGAWVVRRRRLAKVA